MSHYIPQRAEICWLSERLSGFQGRYSCSFRHLTEDGHFLLSVRTQRCDKLFYWRPRQQSARHINVQRPHWKPLPHSVLLRHYLHAIALDTASVSSCGSLDDVTETSSPSVQPLFKRRIARIYLLSPGVFRVCFVPTSVLVMFVVFCLYAPLLRVKQGRVTFNNKGKGCWCRFRVPSETRAGGQQEIIKHATSYLSVLLTRAHKW